MMDFMEIKEILRYLPHRYPFLLVDRIVEMELGERVVGVKNVTFNEPCFTGHFPENPVMPGVLILESFAQTAAILAFKTENKMPDKHSTVYYVGIEKARFKRPIVPGDQLVIEVHILRKLRNIWRFHAVGTVDGQVAAEAEIMCALTLD